MREIERLLILAPRVAISSGGISSGISSGDGGGGVGSKGQQQQQQQQALQYVGGRAGAESSPSFVVWIQQGTPNTNNQSTP